MTIDRRYSVAEGTAFKAPCRVATTVNITLGGLQAIDGVTVAEHDRVLVKNQSDLTLNGIYEASTGNWRRTKDFDGARDIVKGTKVFVSSGAHDRIEYTVTSSDPIIIGTSAITFTAAGDSILTQAQAAADLATANAALLGNQVHQYDTRAQALAAPIPVAVTNVIIKREAAGYPLCNAPYVQGTIAGPRAFLNNGVYWELDLTGGAWNTWFGMKGDDSHDDYSAMVAFKAASKVRYWSPGTYKFGTPIDWTDANSRDFNFGRATLHFTGTGIGLSIDGGAVTGGCYDQTFGSPAFPFKVIGNANCTNLVLCRATHQCNINVIGRDCTTAALVVLFAVNSKFYIKCSTNDGGAMSPLPPAALILGRRGVGEGVVDCEFEVIAEGLSGTGITAQYAQQCRFIGTSEGNAGGGVVEGTGCERIIWERFHCEVNSGTDWVLIATSQTQLNNCAGGELNLQSAARVLVTGGEFVDITVDVASTRCHFDDVHYTNSWAMNSPTSTWRNVYDGAGVYLQDVLKRPQNYASLAAPSASISGAYTTVTDSTTNTWGATISAGGGPNTVLAFCDGAVWKVAG